jgi:hypothetical protein
MLDAVEPSAIRIDAAAYLEVVRQRREHYYDLFKQCETRSMYFSGLLTAVIGGSVAQIADVVAKGASAQFYVKLLVAAAACLFALPYAILLLMPLEGRHFFAQRWLSWLDAALAWLCRLAVKSSPYLSTIATENALDGFSRTVVLRGVVPPAFDGSAAAALIKAELWNTHAQWLVLQLKTGLLRQAILVFLVAAVAVTAVYLDG